MFRRSSVVHVVDGMARGHRRDRAQDELTELVVGVTWALWGVRVELATLLALVGMQRAAATVLGDVAALVVVVVLSGAVLGLRPARVFVVRVFRAMRVRRAWARATIDCGVAAGPFRCPGVWSVKRVPAGELLDVRVRRGQSVAELDKRAEHLSV